MKFDMWKCLTTTASSSGKGNALLAINYASTWWRLFQKRVVHTKCDIYLYITITEIDTTAGGLLVPNGQQHPPSSQWFCTEMGYYIFCLSCKSFGLLVPKSLFFYYERTWWRLFQKRFVRTKFDIYVLIRYSLLLPFKPS
jgi:hypothetical protein